MAVRAAPGCFSWCKSQTMGTNSKNTLGKGAIAKEKVGQKNVWKFVPLRGGGVGRLMANAILNFHFDYLNPSLIKNPNQTSLHFYRRSCHPFLRLSQTKYLYYTIFNTDELLINIWKGPGNISSYGRVVKGSQSG